MNLDNIDISKLPADIRKTFKQLQVLHAEKKIQNKAKNDFLSFVKCVWPDFVEGSHHRHIAEKFNQLATGEINRLIINMPPRHSKSEFASYLMPAWFLGRNPKLKIIQATHNTELAVRFGRKVRDLIDDPQYKDIFPDTNLKEDNKGAGKWQTDKGGEYFAAGVGAAVTGRGADLFIIDDPHSEQDALSESAFDNAYEWYTSGPRQRLQPGGSIIVVMTRWGKKDLTGRLMAAQGEPRATPSRADFAATHRRPRAAKAGACRPQRSRLRNSSEKPDTRRPASANGTSRTENRSSSGCRTPKGSITTSGRWEPTTAAASPFMRTTKRPARPATWAA